MNRTPASAKRRAIRHMRPKLAVTGSSRPYSFCVAADSRRDVFDLGQLRLHAEGQLERIDAGFERRLRAGLGQVLAVHRGQAVELQPLDVAATGGCWRCI